jgi:YD repeat-containing protein
MKWALVCTTSAFAWSAAHAAETITYTYDALGRLTAVQAAGGPAAGVQRNYQFDAAGNRTQVVVTGATTNAVVAVNPFGAVAVATANGVALGVSISGDGSFGGTVTFTENGVFLGVASVVGGQASVFLEGLALGAHTITATYSGDGLHEPQVHTFTVHVRDLSWLPAVLDLILEN